MLLQLGTYKFEGLKLPESWSSSKETKYSEIPIIGGKPSIQKVGQSLDKIDLEISFSAEYCNPQQEMDALNLSRINGEVMQLVDGTGRNYGKYVITTISEANRQCLSNGFPILITAAISLLEYNSQTVSSVTGEALISKSPIEQEKAPQVVTTQSDIMNTIKNGSDASKEITVTDNPSAGMLTKIKKAAESVSNTFNSAISKIQETEKLVYRLSSLVSSLQTAAYDAQVLASYAASGNITALAGAKSSLDSSVILVNDNSSLLAGIIGSREDLI